MGGLGIVKLMLLYITIRRMTKIKAEQTKDFLITKVIYILIKSTTEKKLNFKRSEIRFLTLHHTRMQLRTVFLKAAAFLCLLFQTGAVDSIELCSTNCLPYAAKFLTKKSRVTSMLQR